MVHRVQIERLKSSTHYRRLSVDTQNPEDITIKAIAKSNLRVLDKWLEAGSPSQSSLKPQANLKPAFNVPHSASGSTVTRTAMGTPRASLLSKEEVVLPTAGGSTGQLGQISEQGQCDVLGQPFVVHCKNIKLHQRPAVSPRRVRNQMRSLSPTMTPLPRNRWQTLRSSDDIFKCRQHRGLSRSWHHGPAAFEAAGHMLPISHGYSDRHIISMANHKFGNDWATLSPW